MIHKFIFVDTKCRRESNRFIFLLLFQLLDALFGQWGIKGRGPVPVKGPAITLSLSATVGYAEIASIALIHWETARVTQF